MLTNQNSEYPCYEVTETSVKDILHQTGGRFGMKKSNRKRQQELEKQQVRQHFCVCCYFLVNYLLQISIMAQQPSTQAELAALKADWNEEGLSWEAFGNCSETDIEGIKMQWFPDNAVRRGRIHDVWVRHPNRQGIFHFPFFSFLALHF